MAYLTKAEARAAFRATPTARQGITASATLSKATRGSPLTQTYDIFLSQSLADADVVAGVVAILEQARLAVYVDWRDDAGLDRSKVSPANADRTRSRMRHCKSFLFVTSASSPTSKWMPWELGYFDGLRGDRVAIVPVVDRSSDQFIGQEYLGLYPRFERIGVSGDFQNFVVDRSAAPPKYRPLRSFVAGSEGLRVGI